MFDVANDRGFSTSMYAGKNRFRLFRDSYDGTNGAVDAYLADGDQGSDKIDTEYVPPARPPTPTS